MSYATVAEFKLRTGAHYASLYSDDTLAEMDLASAQAEVDAHIQARYVIPVTDAQTLTLLRTFVLTLSEEIAWSRIAPDTLPESLNVRVRAVRDNLKLISDGTLRLSAATVAVTPAASAAFTKSDTPIFTRENMGGF